ncbi:MAG TPA: complex I subunit 1 family protein [Cytophagaceae bacterium]
MVIFLIFLVFILAYALFAVYAERKVAAFMQDRYGPMEVGHYGLAQTIADILKLFIKEDIVPAKADKPLFKMAPVIIFTSVFAGFAALPIGPDIIGSGINLGVFYLMTIISLDVIGLLMAGWGSNNKYSLYGALRGVAQVLSYEVPLSLCILAVVMVSQTLDLTKIGLQQGIYLQSLAEYADWENYLFGIKALGINITEAGGFLTWNIFRMPLFMISFVIFFIASLAECNRAPFDIPEAESELVAGFHTEYSGFRFAILFLGEYALMLLVAFLGVILFLGSWNTPFPNIGPVKLAEWTSGAPGTIAGTAWGTFWLLFKVACWILIQMAARWTYPRLRIDQLLYLSWKVLTPAALIIVFIAGVWRLLMI